MLRRLSFRQEYLCGLICSCRLLPVLSRGLRQKSRAKGPRTESQVGELTVFDNHKRTTHERYGAGVGVVVIGKYFD